MMLYREVENRTDMTLGISIEQQIPFYPILEREIDTIPLDFQVTDKGAFIDLFICGEPGLKLETMLMQYRPTRIGECLILRMSADEMVTASEILGRIDEIPRSVRGSLYLKDGKINVEYRVNECGKKRITSVIGDVMEMKNRIRIVDLGPGGSGIASIEAVNSRITLSVVAYEVDILQDLHIGHEECYIEYNFHGEEKRGFRAMIHTQNDTEIKYLDSPFLREIQRFSVEAKVPKAAILARPVEGVYRSFTFLPSVMRDAHLSILYSAARKYPESGFTLVASRSYSRDVWNWV